MSGLLVCITGRSTKRPAYGLNVILRIEEFDWADAA